MDQYEVKLEHISKKIGILIARYNELKESCKGLEAENARLKEQLKAESQSSKALKDDLNVVKIAKNISSTDETERTELKKKINEFIKEIDKCVALLND